MVRYLCSAALLFLAGVAGAFAAPSPSQISRVTLYPGSATVERVGHADGGVVQVLFDCLPADFDAQSLRAEGDASLRIGDVRVTPLPPSRAEACRRNPLDDRVKALEDQRAAVDAENDANELVGNYLRTLNAAPDAARPVAGDLRNLAANTDILLRNAQASFAKRQALKRRMEDLDRDLTALREERDRSVGANANFRSVRVSVQSERGGDLRLVYQVNRAGWTPSYRASLDTQTGALVLQRDALIAQSTGENWSGVQLRLSTGQPRNNPSGPEAQLWEIGVMAPQERQDLRKFYAPAPAMAAAPVAERVMRRVDDAPLFDISAFNGTYATEFSIAGSVTLPADGQKLSVSLGTQTLSAKLLVRTTPRLDAAAYLTAQVDHLDGIWPRGTLTLQRDGSYIGAIPSWQPGQAEKVSIPFGRDEQVRVTVEPSANFTASAGLLGGRVEHQIHSSYEIRNDHRTPVTVEVLESVPTSTNQQVEVRKSFVPAVTTEAWEKRPGIAAWQFTLGAGEKAGLKADYVVSHSKDVQITGL